MLKAGQRFRQYINERGDVAPDIWRVLYVNNCRAHCASERIVIAQIGDRAFEATSSRTLDIGPNSFVQLVTDADAPRVAAMRKDATPHTITPGTFVITNGTQYLRRIQITQAPGYRYDVVERDRATEYKRVRSAQRAHDEFQGGDTADATFDVREG